MRTSTAAASADRLSQEICDLVTELSLVTPRGRRRPGDLKETEYLTLALLHERGTMIVGDIQRVLNVLPAQMSRIVRSLESRDRPYIACRINPTDKRKVDVLLTNDGQKIFSDYRKHRVERILDIIRELDDDDQETLATLLERIREVMRSRK
jgi:DNA-binding MarR family transcriptional regulator